MLDIKTPRHLKAMVLSVIIACAAAPISTVVFGQQSQDDIAYLQLTDGYWQVWLTNRKGAEHRQVTNTAYDKAAVSWAANGETLLISGVDGKARFVAVETGDEQTISDLEFAYDAEYHPSEPALIYTRPTSSQFDNNTLWRIDFNTDENRKISTFDGLHQTPTWTRDGAIVFSVRQKRGFLHLWLLDDTAEIRLKQLTVDQADHFDPSVSSLGGLAYTKSEDGNYDIYRRDTLDGTERRVTNDPAFDGEPSWAPGAEEIVFHSTRDGGAGIWLLSVDSTQLQRLTPSQVQARSPTWRAHQ